MTVTWQRGENHRKKHEPLQPAFYEPVVKHPPSPANEPDALVHEPAAMEAVLLCRQPFVDGVSDRSCLPQLDQASDSFNVVSSFHYVGLGPDHDHDRVPDPDHDPDSDPDSDPDNDRVPDHDRGHDRGHDPDRDRDP